MYLYNTVLDNERSIAKKILTEVKKGNYRRDIPIRRWINECRTELRGTSEFNFQKYLEVYNNTRGLIPVDVYSNHAVKSRARALSPLQNANPPSPPAQR